MAFTFSLIIPALFIAIIILIIAGIKVSTNEGGEHVIKNIFIYLVLFATLMMTIGGSVAVFMAAADIVAPVPYHQSFEEYKQWGHLDKPYREGITNEETQVSEEELRKRYNSIVLDHQQRQVDRAKNNLIKSLGWIIIPLPIFLYYQRRLPK